MSALATVTLIVSGFGLLVGVFVAGLVIGEAREHRRWRGRRIEGPR